MKIAIIDDSPYKVASLELILDKIYPSAEIRVAKSFQGALNLFSKFIPDIILLDMSLPTSEKEDGRPCGRDRIYGGQELMEEMEFLDIHPKVIIVSQFDEFGNAGNTVELTTLLANLKRDYPNLYAGGFFYSTIDSAWTMSLTDILQNISHTL